MIFILEDNNQRIGNFKMALGAIESHFEKTVPDAIKWLLRCDHRIRLFSLDNDLYVPECGGDEGEGWQLCEWLIANTAKRPLVIHTTNINAAARMETACADGGWQYRRVPPYDGFRWIHQSWIDAVQRFAY